ncbi:hypothetical protein [Embleya sp. NPDC020630]|uniref:hypothetical protein n=1 Tax=Embleya sp. NPDC020630 TaxID=3363979 RepID=UPI0037BC031F
MNDDENVPVLDVPHETWWLAPMLTSVIGVPLVVCEFVALVVRDVGGFLEFVIWAAAVLFVIAWTLPHTRANRGIRMTTAVGGLVCALAPALLVSAMGASL